MKNSRCFVVGDIHGCIKTLKKLLCDILQIQKDEDIYFLGDYIDRGPAIKEVIDLIIMMKEQGFKIHPLRGNHEQMLLDAYFHNKWDDWKKNDCYSTLKSFNLNSILDLEKKYLDFFTSLEYYFVLDKFILTHAGLNFNIDNPFDDKEAMLWSREYYVDKAKTGGRRLISGHSPHTLEQIRASLNEDKIQLDGGCVYFKKHKGLGYLCAIEVNTMELYSQINIEE